MIFQALFNGFVVFSFDRRSGLTGSGKRNEKVFGTDFCRTWLAGGGVRGCCLYYIVSRCSPGRKHDVRKRLQGQQRGVLLCESRRADYRGNARAFSSYLKNEHSDGNKVLLHSPGGSLIAGLELGELIRARGMETEIGIWKSEGTFGDTVDGGYCMSACSYAFLGVKSDAFPRETVWASTSSTCPERGLARCRPARWTRR